MRGGGGGMRKSKFQVVGSNSKRREKVMKVRVNGFKETCNMWGTLAVILFVACMGLPFFFYPFYDDPKVLV